MTVMGIRSMGAAACSVVVVATLLVGCAADPPDARSSATLATPTAASTTADATSTTADATSTTADAPTTTAAATTTTEQRIELPEGQLVAVPLQNREDPAKGQFQLQLVNDTDGRFTVRSVQFEWAGFSSPVTPRQSQIVGGQTIDFPVPFPGATCAGDGSIATMPPLDDARVLLGLDDGTIVDVPVVDRWHLARRLYLQDCQRQAIASAVTIEWTDLRRTEHAGRPVTAGLLRLTRRTSTERISVVSVSGTIPYGVEVVDTSAGQTIVELAPGDDVAEARIRFVEGRCDPHALAETKQPHAFVAQVDLGDGVLVPFIVVPPEAEWTTMRRTADEACVATGQVVFVGDEEPAAP